MAGTFMEGSWWDQEVSDLDVLQILEIFHPADLEDVYVRLGLRYSNIQNIKLSDGHNPKKQARNILNLWRKRNGVAASRGAFLEAAEKCPDCYSSMHQLKSKWIKISEKSDVPEPDNIRGQDGQRAYEASQEAGIPRNRIQLMLVGHHRAGKTSLMKNLTGQTFDDKEESTEGVDATTLCEVPVGSGHTWQLLESAMKDLAKYLNIKFDEALCTEMARLLHVMKDKDLGKKEVETEILEAIQASAQQPSEERAEIHIPDNIVKRVLELLEQLKLRGESKKDERKNVLECKVWDFAGQDVYYTTHQVFLRHRAIYLVVFDLSLDLDNKVADSKKHKIWNSGKHKSVLQDFTGLDFLDFWMQSIFAYATKSTEPEDEETRTHTSPPIFVIGTHSNEISLDPEERKKLIAKQLKKIQVKIAGKPYRNHVIGLHSIDNNSKDQNDPELKEMREKIAFIASQEPYMREEIELCRFKFERSVAEAVKNGQYYMRQEKVEELIKDLEIKHDDLLELLQFYHDLGTIIYFGGKDNRDSPVKDMVILDPQWLMDVFKRIITIKPWNDRVAIRRESWRKLEEEAILDHDLLNHMLGPSKNPSDASTKDSLEDLRNHKDFILSVMLHFDLLCKRISDKESMSYYVPACLKPCSHKDSQAYGHPAIFYIDFKGFLSDGIFHRLLVLVAGLSQAIQKRECKEKSDIIEPKLRFRQGRFYVDGNHEFRLRMHGTHIQVLVSRHKTDRPDSDDQDPSPDACCMVHDKLTTTLKDLKPTLTCGIDYEFSVDCRSIGSASQSQETSEDPCLHNMEKCLKATQLYCLTREISITVRPDCFLRNFQIPEDDDLLEPESGGLFLQHIRTAPPPSDYQKNKDKCYTSMLGRNKGLAFILNILDFKEEENKRKGSEVDHQNMVHLFKQLGYDTEEHKNLTAEAIGTTIDTFVQRFTKEHASSVVVLMSHGEEGKMSGADGKYVSLDEIFSKFKTCNHLIGKPKLFFIQACRGGKMQSAAYPVEPDDRVTVSHKVPEAADFYCANATAKGYLSWRHKVTGSWFVNAIMRAFLARAHEDNLDTLMNQVNNQVVKTVGYYIEDKDEKYKEIRQVAEVKKTTRKEIFFHPERKKERERKKEEGEGDIKGRKGKKRKVTNDRWEGSGMKRKRIL